MRFVTFKFVQFIRILVFRIPGQRLLNHSEEAYIAA